MRAVLALARARWLDLTSYRMRMAVSIGGLAASVVPLWFIAGAVEPVMADAIADEGGQAFGFLLLGLTALSVTGATVGTLHSEIGGGIRTGTLEAILATPTSLLEILVGMSAFQVAWASLRAAGMIAVGVLLGANVVPWQIPEAILIYALLAAAHLPLGVIGAALVLWFRTAGPFPTAVLTLSGLLGGVYYPVDVVPSWLALGSAVLPLTYGLRALRRVFLEGESLLAVGGDLAVLTALGLLLAVLGGVMIRAALRYARQQGTLAQY